MAKQLEKTLGKKQQEGDTDEEFRRKNAELQKEMREAGAIKIDNDTLGNLLPSDLNDLSSQYDDVTDK